MYWTEAGEQKRQAVNEWIRSSGAYDGVIDFDAAVRDPGHTQSLRRVVSARRLVTRQRPRLSADGRGC